MRHLRTLDAKRAAALLVAALAIGCLPVQPGVLGPAALRDWPAVLASAQSAAGARHYDVADASLAEFATRYPGTPEAQETDYWRALFRLDPLNQSASPSAAAALLDTYLAGGATVAHRSEAETLHRLAAELDALTRVAAAVPTPNGAPAAAPGDRSADLSADLKARDAEVQRLKDELAKANDELERIKRRLATPTKPPE